MVFRWQILVSRVILLSQSLRNITYIFQAQFISPMTDRLAYISTKTKPTECYRFSYSLQLPFTDIALTWLPTINSARTKFISQPPPIRKEMYFPLMLKDGVVRVPWGISPCNCPAGTSGDGRCSLPPIHQFPC